MFFMRTGKTHRGRGGTVIERVLLWFRGTNDPQSARRDRECARRRDQIARGVLKPQSRGI